MQKRLLSGALLLGLCSGSAAAGLSSSEEFNANQPELREAHSLEQALLGALGGEQSWRLARPWEDSLRRYLAPEGLSGLLPGNGVATGWAINSVHKAFSFDWQSGGSINIRWKQTAMERGFFGRSTGHVAGAPGMAGLDAGLSLRQDMVSPTLVGGLNDRVDWNVSAVFAFQEIAPLSVFNVLQPIRELDSSQEFHVHRHRIRDRAKGAGVRMGLAYQPTDALQMQASYRSRISMGEFASFRGVFLQPGQIDLPAIASANLTWQALPSARVNLQAQRVMFGSVEPFVSAQLPISVLSVLGDLDSPDFAWRDLNVLSLGAVWDFTADWRAELDYSSSYQPRPTSELLDRLLANESPDDNLRLGVVRQLGPDMSLDLSARYNGGFILGLPIYMQREADRVNTVEWQAQLAWNF